MLNKFPLWKNSLILIAALFAFVYASPNYFPADAAIQLSGQSGSMIIDEDVSSGSILVNGKDIREQRN